MEAIRPRKANRAVLRMNMEMLFENPGPADNMVTFYYFPGSRSLVHLDQTAQRERNHARRTGEPPVIDYP